MTYYPEGKCRLLNRRFEELSEAREAMRRGDILEGRVILCDGEHNLHIDLGAVRGIIPRCEGAVGIEEGEQKDIALISRVNKSVCFKITEIAENDVGRPTAFLSRKAVQEECIKNYLDKLKIGDVIDASVTHLDPFGAFIDVGAGINALIPIDMLCVSRINHPRERLTEGQKIHTVLKNREAGKLTFSLKELLGTWEENAALFSQGETVTGVVRSIESYGIFVELMPNLAGLAELQDGITVGQEVSVYIKAIIPEKMKVKLVIVERFDLATEPTPLNCFTDEKHIDIWRYSPSASPKQISTVFG